MWGVIPAAAEFGYTFSAVSTKLHPFQKEKVPEKHFVSWQCSSAARDKLPGFLKQSQQLEAEF